MVERKNASKDLELWDIIERDPMVPMAKDDKGEVIGPKTWEQYTSEDVEVVQKNAKTKKILT